MGGEDFSEYSLPDHSIPAVDFHVGAVAPEKIAASKKPGAPPLAKSALEQVRARAGADHPHWTDRDDERGAGFDEEVGVNALCNDRALITTRGQ